MSEASATAALTPLASTVEVEFERQMANLVDRGYPAAAAMSPSQFLRLFEPLRRALSSAPAPAANRGPGAFPFVLVVSDELIPVDRTISLADRAGNAGFSVMHSAELQRFTPIPGLTVPDGSAYLLLDVDTGSDLRNVTPDAALEVMARAARSPLTIAEGIALITQFPAALRKNHCFSLGGSRCGDRRVPALWISEKRPKLGWCWAGNPHTWLGFASCAARRGSQGGP